LQRRGHDALGEEVTMEELVERCCGLDVHQATVVACLMRSGTGKRVRKESRTFGTTTTELEQLREWLAAEQCTHVGMESTGIYWVPVYAVLEGSFDLIVGNATHIKNVPGRKTDMKDAEWLATLVRHGLIRKSFVPPPWQRKLRDLVRYRRKLVQAQASERNRLLRLLESCNIKLSSVATDVFGVSGRAMLRALAEGTATPQEMAELARGTLRRKADRLALALRGQVAEHHRFLLKLQLQRIERTEADIATVDATIDEAMSPHRDVQQRLTEIPGVDRIVAVTIVAELGVDMQIFPTARHAAAWAGVCPGNNESAGKHKHQGKRKGNVHLASALVQAALGARRAKGTYLKERYWRLAARRGPKRAAVAIAHKILVAAYAILAGGVTYRDLGEGYADRLTQRSAVQKHVRRLEALGFTVQLEPAT
jgi:transposase